MLELTDRIDVDRVDAIAGLLDVDDVLRAGDPLPLHWQVGFFLPRARQSELGSDGHPKQGYPTPPAPNLRRMFAGGRVRMQPGLTIGREYVARTAIIASESKTGRAGTLEFITTRTEVCADGEVALVEDRNIVYLPEAPPAPRRSTAGRPVAAPAAEGDVVGQVQVDPVLLFRFSALTYNAHRIHYDTDYARDTEGHPGLVVHGPLQALLMAEAGASLLGRGSLEMDYQLVSPLLQGQGLIVRAHREDDTARLAITDEAGRTTAKAVVRHVG